jgi:hypothetical protein
LESTEERSRSRATAFIGSAALVVVLGLIIAAFQTTVVTDMVWAHSLMALAWCITVIGIYLLPSHGHKIKSRWVRIGIVSVIMVRMDFLMVKKRADDLAMIAARPPLSIECDREFFPLSHNDQTALLPASRVARIKVTNMGEKGVANVKAVVIGVIDGAILPLQLPLSSQDRFFNFPTPSPADVSVNLRPSGEQYFAAVIECNGEVCPKGQLAVPYSKGERYAFAPLFKPGSASGPNEFAFIVSGAGVQRVVRTFTLSVGPEGQLLLKAKADG